MSNKDTEQKYFVGNWIQDKRNPERIAFINEVFEQHGHYFYYTAFVAGDSTIPFLGQGEVERNYNIIPCPWHLFFKVGDKVIMLDYPDADISTLDVGTIVEINPPSSDPRSIYVKEDGREYPNLYAPHELIKIGE